MEDLQVLFEDNHILVAVKPQNVPSQADSSNDEDMVTIVKKYLVKKYNKKGDAYVGLVHRLDRPTGGVMVFAKTDKAASRLSLAIREGELEKTYLCVVEGTLKEESGKLTHYLKKNAVTNTVYAVPQTTEGAKRAELLYDVLETRGKYSLVKVRLLTGRGHQIRVQMAESGCIIVGDVRYGSKEKCKMGLWATCVKFEHPVTKKTMLFIDYPPEEESPWKFFDIDRHLKLR